jgi:tetratricopeptide (TPR) repeat protein
MSKSKTQEPAVGTPELQDGKKTSLSFSKKTKVVTSLAVLLLAVGGVLLWKANQAPSSKDILTAENKNNYTSAIDMLNKSIAKTKSPATKSKLYLELGSDYGNSNQADKAIDAYKKAATANGMTAMIAQSIADAYYFQGNKEQAIVYYQKAIDVWPKTDPLYNSEVSSLQQTIKDLEK